LRISDICAASADGKKKPVAVIDKGKEKLIKYSDGIVQLTGQKSWMNSNLFIQWIEYSFPILTTNPNKTLLVFDSARSHISIEVKNYLKRRKIFYAVIPGGLTAWLQPADLCWFKTFKFIVREEAEDYLKSNLVARTRSGAIRLPDIQIVGRWLVRAWNEISS
jgi:hypothetical protein